MLWNDQTCATPCHFSFHLRDKGDRVFHLKKWVEHPLDIIGTVALGEKAAVHNTCKSCCFIRSSRANYRSVTGREGFSFFETPKQNIVEFEKCVGSCLQQFEQV